MDFIQLQEDWTDVAMLLEQSLPIFSYNNVLTYFLFPLPWFKKTLWQSHIKKRGFIPSWWMSQGGRSLKQLITIHHSQKRGTVKACMGCSVFFTPWTLCLGNGASYTNQLNQDSLPDMPRSSSFMILDSIMWIVNMITYTFILSQRKKCKKEECPSPWSTNSFVRGNL